MGYLTATKEWYRRNGRPDGWRDFWYDPKARHLYFVGKDNIVFHTLFWPAILMGYDEKLTLPYDVPATQYLNFSGERMSTGRGRGIWLPELLERFDPDQIGPTSVLRDRHDAGDQGHRLRMGGFRT
jgi:methionyl-tRNA synthetase